MTDFNNDGGDIASGHGDPEVDGPVSDEKAEQMLHGNPDVVDTDGTAEASVFAVDSEGTVQAPDDADASRPEGAGGGGGGGW